MCILAQQNHGKGEEKVKSERRRQLCLDADILKTLPEKIEGLCCQQSCSVRGTRWITEDGIHTQKNKLGSLSYQTYENQLK